MPVALVYLAIILIGTLSVAARHEPILLTGRRWLWLNTLALAGQLVIRPAPPALWIVLFGLLGATAWFSRTSWFVFKAQPSTIRSAIESRLQRVLVQFTPVEEGYQLDLAGGPAGIRIRQPFRWVLMLTFDGNWQQNKARVVQAFLMKFFEPIIPRLRFKV